MSKKLKVKIVSNPKYKEGWYNGLIGEEIEVVEEYGDVYHVAKDIEDGLTMRRYIKKSDCEIVAGCVSIKQQESEE